MEIRSKIFLVLVGIFLVSVAPSIYATPEPMPEDSFRFSDHVLTGKVVSSKVIPNHNEDTPQKKYLDTVVYEIQVLEWHKNPLDNNIITVYGDHYPNDVEPEPMWGVVEFEIGSTVYLYLDESEDGLHFRAHSSYLVKTPEPDTYWEIVVESPKLLPPLKQFKSEILFHEIKCKGNLQLTQRHDGAPACVKQDTYFELIKRDWTSEIIKAVQSRDLSLPESEPTLNKDETISENTNPYTWYDITGLNQVYRLGEPISFTETVQGYDNPCVRQHYEILDSNTLEPVWEYKGMVYPCPFFKDPLPFKIIRTFPDENTPLLLLNQTGPYIFRSYHTYSDGYTVKTFSIVDDSLVTHTVDPCNVVYDLDANDLRKRTPPPTSIGGYGRDAMVIEPFVFDTSIGKLSTPSYLPSCYELKSDKIKDDLRTLVFYPNDMTYDDGVTITKIIKEGVFILVSNTSETPEEWSDSVEKPIKESPDTVSSVMLKDIPVLLISGIPSKDMPSTVKMIVDDKKIQVISTKLDTTYLMDVLESMFKIENSNSLRPEDRLQVSNTAGYTTVYVTLSSWDEYNHWESKRGDEHDKMPPLVITQDNINPIVFDLIQEMWKFEDYDISNHDPHLFKKKIQKDYSVPNHHGIHDWMESEYAKQFGQSNDGFSHYFEFQDNVYTITMLVAD